MPFYNPPTSAITREIVAEHEQRFLLFIKIIIPVILIGPIIAWKLTPSETFLSTECYVVGSLLVFSSVFQSRYIDIKRNSNPHSRPIDPAVLHPKIAKIESSFKHFWLAGSLLLFVSHWM